MMFHITYYQSSEISRLDKIHAYSKNKYLLKKRETDKNWSIFY